MAAYAWILMISALLDALEPPFLSVERKIRNFYWDVQQRLPLVLNLFFQLTYGVIWLLAVLISIAAVSGIYGLYMVGPVACLYLFKKLLNILVYL